MLDDDDKTVAATTASPPSHRVSDDHGSCVPYFAPIYIELVWNLNSYLLDAAVGEVFEL